MASSGLTPGLLSAGCWVRAGSYLRPGSPNTAPWIGQYGPLGGALPFTGSGQYGPLSGALPFTGSGLRPGAASAAHWSQAQDTSFEKASPSQTVSETSIHIFSIKNVVLSYFGKFTEPVQMQNFW